VRILITGASGFIGSHLGQRLSRDHEILGIAFQTRKPLPFRHDFADLTDDYSVSALLQSFKPQVIVHAAAMSKVAQCEDQPEAAREINAAATARLTRWSQRLSAKLVFLSSDQVFDGRKGGYRESDAPHPISEYGLTKLEAERMILSSETRAVILRSNSVVGHSMGWGESFSDWILNRLRAGQPVPLYIDQYRSPIHVNVITEILALACITDMGGLIHAGGPKRMSRLQVGFAVSRAYGLSTDLFEEHSFMAHSHAAVMTADTSYDISHLKQILPLLKQRSLDEDLLDDAEKDKVRHENS
jgi:dTDP-4-dehydrorhamnose reductase